MVRDTLKLFADSSRAEGGQGRGAPRGFAEMVLGRSSSSRSSGQDHAERRTEDRGARAKGLFKRACSWVFRHPKMAASVGAGLLALFAGVALAARSRARRRQQEAALRHGQLSEPERGGKGESSGATRAEREERARVDSTADALLRAAAHWNNMAEQDTNPVAQLIHQAHALAYLNALRLLIGENAISRRYALSPRELLSELEHQQSEHAARLGQLCPRLLNYVRYPIISGFVA